MDTQPSAVVTLGFFNLPSQRLKEQSRFHAVKTNDAEFMAKATSGLLCNLFFSNGFQ